MYRATGKQAHNSVKPWYLCTRNDRRVNRTIIIAEKCANISNADVGKAQEKKGKAIDRYLSIANTKKREKKCSDKI